MFVNIFSKYLFVFDFCQKDYAKPKPYIMYMYVTESSENTPGRVDPGPT